MSSRTLDLKVPVALAHGATSSLSRRAAAFGIDIVLVATISLAVSIGLHLLLVLFVPSVLEQERWVVAGAFAVCATAYFVGFWTREGSTPGQHIMGLRLALAEYPDNPGPIGGPRAVVRFATMVGSGILLLDFLVAFLHRERRSLHDLAAGTIVVSES
ncbi:MAG TPA: RDD family protein [Thermoanaerobaculia bacterium]|nr:RDD family protein [Thermoanaerobaculia bacterium]